MRMCLGACAATVVAGGLTLGVPSMTEACGGCFAPPPTATEQVLVTGHRMAVSVSATETTLWDQFQYAGDPEDFAWILPIQGTATVELADNAFFEALEQATRLQLVGTYPPLRRSCSEPCSDSLFGSGSDDRGSADLDGGTGVTVYNEAVVGPYETATIGSEDPEALIDWLNANGYMVPPDTLPAIEHYVGEGLNFAALKLNPNAGVDQMQPVRVTTPGAMPVFPLRMVAAGAAELVGMVIYVFGEGRWGSDNYPSVELDRSRIVYDWATDSFNYGEVFDATLGEHDGRAWIVEFADRAPASFIRGYVSFDDDGTEHRAAEDFGVVTRSIPEPWVTVLRTEMPRRHLTEDLVLEAVENEVVPSRVEVPRDVNRPPEPDCPTGCTDPVGGAAATGLPGSPSRPRVDAPEGLCSGAGRGRPVAAWAALGLAGLMLCLRRRRPR